MFFFFLFNLEMTARCDPYYLQILVAFESMNTFQTYFLNLLRPFKMSYFSLDLFKSEFYILLLAR